MNTPALSFVKHISASAYLAPWQNKNRATLMLGSLIALLAGAMQSLIFTYNMTAYGIGTVVIFQVLRMGLLGFFGFALCYKILSLRHGTLWLLAFQITGVALSLFDPANPITNGVASAMLSAGFWSNYHYLCGQTLSKENHGSETALFCYLQALANAAGFLMAGYVLDRHLYLEGMLISGLLITISTFMISVPIARKENYKAAKNIIHWRKPSTQITFLLGCYYCLCDIGLPSFMQICGISPLSTSFSLAIGPLIGLFITPIAGRLTQSNRKDASYYGGLILAMGWLTLALTLKTPELLVLVTTLLAVGYNLLSPLEINRWIRRKSTSGIVARELLLASARTPGSLLVLPALFIAPLSLPILGVITSLAYVIGSKSKKSAFKMPLTRAPVIIPSNHS